jgi:hypothetical protein
MSCSKLTTLPYVHYQNNEEEFDHYIVVSFSNATLVLSIGED